MATMVLYCTVPETGGHTNFRNAGVHVKPRQGNGVFFSYIDPETMMMDDGRYSASRCSDCLPLADSERHPDTFCTTVFATHGIGFTEHSGCPVYEGEKKIVTQWIRLGVDDENPWDALNTLGVKKGEEEG